MKKVIVSVINDLVSDNRVDRACSVLQSCGYEVLLVGRKKRSSPKLTARTYQTFRMKLIFEKEFLFYAAYNFRLFLLLLFKKSSLLYANDLDTLLPNFLVSKIKRIPLIYDSHEYFTEVPELQNSRFAKKFWERLERWIFPKLKNVITVCHSIASIYQEKYKVDVKVVRNVPCRYNVASLPEIPNLPFDKDKAVIIYQGALNMGRGLEELILAMHDVDDAVLLILGDGDILGDLKRLLAEENLSEKVLLLGRFPIGELRAYTRLAKIGVSLEKNLGLNYYYCLPNKLFDYIHAEVPVLVSDLPEMRRLVEKYQVGEIINSHDPKVIALHINKMLNDASSLKNYKENEKKASLELSWEAESKILTHIINTAYEPKFTSHRF